MKWPTLSLCSKSTCGGCGVSESHRIAPTRAQPMATKRRRRISRSWCATCGGMRAWRILEERELSRIRRGRPEAAAVELAAPAAGAVLVQAVLAAGDLEALRDQLGEVAGAAHARAEARIVVAAAAYLVNDADDALCSLRVMRGEPFLEEVLQLVRQPHDHVGRFFRARRGRRFEHVLHRLVV